MIAMALEFFNILKGTLCNKICLEAESPKGRCAYIYRDLSPEGGAENAGINCYTDKGLQCYRQGRQVALVCRQVAYVGEEAVMTGITYPEIEEQTSSSVSGCESEERIPACVKEACRRKQWTATQQMFSSPDVYIFTNK